MIKILSKLGKKRNLLNLLNKTHKKPMCKIILMVKDGILWGQSGTREDYLLSAYICYCIGGFSQYNKDQKIKRYTEYKGGGETPNCQMTRECYVENAKESTKEATRTNTWILLCCRIQEQDAKINCIFNTICILLEIEL